MGIVLVARKCDVTFSVLTLKSRGQGSVLVSGKVFTHPSIELGLTLTLTRGRMSALLETGIDPRSVRLKTKVFRSVPKCRLMPYLSHPKKQIH